MNGLRSFAQPAVERGLWFLQPSPQTTMSQKLSERVKATWTPCPSLPPFPAQAGGAQLLVWTATAGQVRSTSATASAHPVKLSWRENKQEEDHWNLNSKTNSLTSTTLERKQTKGLCPYICKEVTENKTKDHSKVFGQHTEATKSVTG